MEGKRLKISGVGWRLCQVLGVVIVALGIIEEIKSPCGGRGFWVKVTINSDMVHIANTQLSKAPVRAAIVKAPSARPIAVAIENIT